jgi:hypothetical protein
VVVSRLLQSGTSPIGDQEQLVDDYQKVDGPSCQDNAFDVPKFTVDTEENQGKGNDTKLPNPEICPKSFDGRSNNGIELLPAVI